MKKKATTSEKVLYEALLQQIEPYFDSIKKLYEEQINGDVETEKMLLSDYLDCACCICMDVEKDYFTYDGRRISD